MISKPKILFYDIETTPFKVWTFRIGNKVSISHSSIVKDSQSDIICIAYKWAHEKDVHCLDWGYKKQDSGKMIAAFDKEVSKADLIVAQNGDHFDWRHINTHRMLKGLPNIDWLTPMEDTLKQLRRHFYLPSYKLDYVANLFNMGGKSPMEFGDWIDIVEKQDESKFHKMIKYCKKDVLLLEQVYNKIKMYVKPKASLSKTGFECTVCGSSDVIKNGTRRIGATVIQNYFCNKHGGHAGRSTKSEGGIK